MFFLFILILPSSFPSHSFILILPYSFPSHSFIPILPSSFPSYLFILILPSSFPSYSFLLILPSSFPSYSFLLTLPSSFPSFSFIYFSFIVSFFFIISLLLNLLCSSFQIHNGTLSASTSIKLDKDIKCFSILKKIH